MVQYVIEIGEEAGIELNASPGLPALKRVELWFEDVSSVGEARDRLGQLGGLEHFAISPDSPLLTRLLRLRCAGEAVGDARLYVWVADEQQRPVHPVSAALREDQDKLIAAPGGGV